MKSQTIQTKYFLSIISFLAILTIVFMPLEKSSKKILDEAITEAMVVFGVAKSLNAAISVAQGTQVGPPGINFSIGEVLDPINDLIEQFSWIMLASIASMGLQKIINQSVILEIFTIFSIGSILIYNILLYYEKRISVLQIFFFKLSIILIFLRLGIPSMSLANEYIYTHVVKQNYNIEISKKNIELSSEIVSNINTTSEKKQESFLEKISNAISLESYEKKIDEYKKATENSSDNIINLIIAYLFRTMFFPLIFLFFSYQLIRGIFHYRK